MVIMSACLAEEDSSILSRVAKLKLPDSLMVKLTTDNRAMKVQFFLQQPIKQQDC